MTTAGALLLPGCETGNGLPRGEKRERESVTSVSHDSLLTSLKGEVMARCGVTCPYGERIAFVGRPVAISAFFSPSGGKKAAQIHPITTLELLNGLITEEETNPDVWLQFVTERNASGPPELNNSVSKTLFF